jgi:hypothetical protein
MIGDEKTWNWRVRDRIALEAEAGRLQLEERLVNVEEAYVGGKNWPETFQRDFIDGASGAQRYFRQQYLHSTRLQPKRFLNCLSKPLDSDLQFV